MPYELREPGAVEELAKDVAAFANSGNIPVLGISTGDVEDVEELDALIRERITPPPRQVVVDWSGDRPGPPGRSGLSG
ncbi:hypothetical protein [Streptomyces sp. NPDC056190]|uniref:hypothetical protein n=1 Tax=unclassified Streptomyces TaxID=2593676 RepID=UPI0035D7CE92